MKKYIIFLLILLAMLVGCQSKISIDRENQSKNGITMKITKVEFSETDPIITLIVQVDPQWGLKISDFSLPPQQAIHHNSVLIDGLANQYFPESGTYGLPQLDEETGYMKFENTITFPPVQDKTLNLQTEIEITEIPVSQPVYVSIDNRKVLDVWSIDSEITFNNFTDIPGKIRLLSQDNNSMEIEFTFDRVTTDGIPGVLVNA